MSDTFDMILRLTDERQELYRTAAKEQLSHEQRKYLEELNAKIPLVWDQYRRELATETRQTVGRPGRKGNHRAGHRKDVQQHQVA